MENVFVEEYMPRELSAKLALELHSFVRSFAPTIYFKEVSDTNAVECIINDMQIIETGGIWFKGAMEYLCALILEYSGQPDLAARTKAACILLVRLHCYSQQYHRKEEING